MERCPCCQARLNGAGVCPRCAADLSQVICCEGLARYWLARSMQLLRAQQAEQAVSALNQSLRYQQTRSALIFRDFLLNP